MALVAVGELVTGGPCGLFRENLAVGARHVDGPLYGIENEELRLGTEVSRVTQARGFEISLAALGNGARIAVLALHIVRLDDVATDGECSGIQKGIDE